ncbi:uncharacterized protein [Spinacia oleracea]|uniref:Aspartic peptidase DDI1-type domain-containing protein n=1 Tax=Spinacia oleracea TaxID=3562 RepID=A0A9R0IM90_SPIOL|nr:uncharacterized protein LOC110791527 [Spinacia oleracea]
METFIAHQTKKNLDIDKRLSEVNSSVQQLQPHNKIMETQLGKIAQHVGSSSTSSYTQLPSHTVLNPKEHIKAITLSLGKGYEGPVMRKEVDKKRDEGCEEEEKVVSERVQIEQSEQTQCEKSDSKSEEVVTKESEKAPMKPYKPHIPFPHWVVEKNLNEKYSKFLDVMKGLQVNIPFLHAMTQMPTYAKFFKELLTNKAKLEEAIVSLPMKVSSIIQNKLLKKHSDPGSFSIPMKIGDLEPKNSLCDIGASVSLMPLSMAQRLNVGGMKPTRMSLQLADRSVRTPLGVLEDVPV